MSSLANKPKTPYVAIALAILGALMNCLVRGGGIETAFFDGRNVKGLRIVNAIAYGGLAWWLSAHWVVGAFLCAGMLIGSMPGLGPYIKAMLGDDPKRDELWGFWRLTFRGYMWGCALAIAMFLASLFVKTDAAFPYGIAVLLSGGLQGVIYWALIKCRKAGWAGNKVLNHWTVSEYIHGAPIWASLAVIYHDFMIHVEHLTFVG